MACEQAIFASLMADSNVTDLVGDRIFPDEAQEGEQQPLLVYSVPTSNNIRELSGKVAFRFDTLLVNAYANTFAEAKAIVNAVRECLDTGGDDGAEVPGVTSCYWVDDSTDEADDGYLGAIAFSVCMSG